MQHAQLSIAPLPKVPSLRRVREGKFLSQQDLAALSGVSRVTISRLENGAEEARFVTLRRLAQALEVEPGELVKEAA